MNHSSILQIHLNGGENALSGGEHSIRIFSLASASSSASSLPLLSKWPFWSKSEIKAQATGVPSERRLQSASGLESYLGFKKKKKKKEKKTDSRSFKGFASRGRLKKSRWGKKYWRRSIICSKCDSVIGQLQNRSWNECVWLVCTYCTLLWCSIDSKA